MRTRDLADRLGTVRSAYLQDFSGIGGATLSMYGPQAEAAWSAFESVDDEINRTLRRGEDYEPVAALIASFSTKAGVFVAARYWVGADHGVKDLFTFSTGPVVTALVHSGYTPDLAGNQRWRHVKNIDPRLREDHGFELRDTGWWYPEHHFDAAGIPPSEAPQTRAEIERSARAFFERIAKGG